MLVWCGKERVFVLGGSEEEVEVHDEAENTWRCATLRQLVDVVSTPSLLINGGDLIASNSA
jgi:hypothetical protein